MLRSGVVASARHKPTAARSIDNNSRRGQENLHDRSRSFARGALKRTRYYLPIRADQSKGKGGVGEGMEWMGSRGLPIALIALGLVFGAETGFAQDEPKDASKDTNNDQGGAIRAADKSSDQSAHHF